MRIVMVILFLASESASAATVNTSVADFHVSGTQIGDIPPGTIQSSTVCADCHGAYDAENEPAATWRGSLMAHAARDPLFRAQMATANQDVANVGYFCMRCHVPLSIVSGHAYPADGSALDTTDLDGVACHFCHSMVDPIYKPGISPAEDEDILAALAEVPQHYGNAMFVLDPSGTRRGPYTDPATPHEWIPSAFHRTAEMCGTCHDVGNVAISRSPDGTYHYNALNAPTPDEGLHRQFPLERTYTEWKLSAFADGGVDMGGRFGGAGATIVSTCQDCHMPRATARGCFDGPVRADLARHEFAGAAAPILDLIAALYANDPAVDQVALRRGRAKAVEMLGRAASLTLGQSDGVLDVRVTNESGHKLPTGHIEGRRIWTHVRFLDAAGELVAERGGYDAATATLDEESTTVYEMHVGLSPDAAALTGLPVGPTAHMALADTIEKDTRIPPRGFTNAAFEAAGAPVVGAAFADGQHWHDQTFAIPWRAARAAVSLYYQNTPRDYIEGLRDNNVTDEWGQVLHSVWTQTGRGAPIRMASAVLDLAPRPCTIVNASTQTSRTRLHASPVPGKGRIRTTGTLQLPAVSTIDPLHEEVGIEISDGGGLAWSGIVGEGRMIANAAGTSFAFRNDVAPHQRDGLESVRLRISRRDGLTVRYAVRARANLRLPLAGTGTVTIRVGDTCFVDVADECTSMSSRTLSCK